MVQAKVSGWRECMRCGHSLLPHSQDNCLPGVPTGFPPPAFLASTPQTDSPWASRCEREMRWVRSRDER